MTQTVTDTDGTIHEFPDDATPAEMQAALAKPAGFWSRFGHGMGDVVESAARLISKGGEAVGMTPLIPSKTIEQDIAQREQGYKAPEGMDWARVAGRTAASLPAALIPGGPVVSGLASGAASAAVEPVPPEKPYWETLAKQTAGGAAVGGALGVFGGLLGQIGRRSPKAFNQQALREAAPPGFEDAINTVGHDGVEQLQGAFNQAYEKVLPGLKANIDDKLISDLQGIGRGMPANGATKAEIDQFQSIVDAQILGRSAKLGEAIEGRQAQNAQSELGQMASAYQRDPSVDKQTLGRALGEARQALLEAFQRANPDAADQLAAISSKYPALISVQKAAASAAANEGVFKPKQLLTAIKSTDRTRAKSVMASGSAPLQDVAEAAAQAKVGEPSLIERSLGNVGIGGGIGGVAYGHPEALLAVPAANMAREALQTNTAAAISNAIPPAVKAATPGAVNLLGNTPPGQAMPTGGAPPPVSAPQQFDINQFLKENPPGGGSNNFIDQFFQANPPKGVAGGLTKAIEQQESGGRNVVSPAGAVGPMQIMPTTWRQYAKPGEDIRNPLDNRAVGQRIVASLLAQYGDPRMAAAAYFSGRPDYRSFRADVTGKSTASYVADVMRRMYG